MNKSEQLIACLEGEIAKRDARIAELEAQYQRDVFGLNNEGDPIGGDPAGWYANDNARLRAELAAIKAQEPVANSESGLEEWAAGKFGVGGAFRGELCGNTDWALARLVWSAALAYAAPAAPAADASHVFYGMDGNHP
jgi:hypothetical protein